ncbi:hypothetical protein SBRY_100242 [Actinacidiphila bryophytorum]|uniref:Uncharacterized protein n=1 Tax=Actinacidiphila bryophytorum TaxID=1436133 RepID=A0A9W4E2F6_9ACTN|nr:hypothetical protein SBRY_100242 [Actinacidiphila bryophytorum]
MQGHVHPEHLARRVHHQHHGGQHRLHRRQRLESRLHPALRTSHHQHLERHHQPVLRCGDRHQRRLQRPDTRRRQPVLRLPGHLHRQHLHPTHRLHPQRHHLHHRLTPAAGNPCGSRPPPADPTAGIRSGSRPPPRPAHGSTRRSRTV